jgi:4-amino-4-deoxy-L-arabinose transferase-like glycosyltransferase
MLNCLAKLTGTGIIGVYITQLLLNGIATICFYDLNLKLSSNRLAAFFATLLLICCLPFQKWTVYLFTESIFFSLIIIYLYVLFVPKFQKRVRIFLAVVLFILILLSRPTGLLIIPSTVVLLSLQLIKRRQFISLGLLVIIGMAAFFYVTDVAMHGEGEFDFLKPFVEEHLICGYPQKMNPSESLPSGGNSLAGVLDYTSHHFTQFLDLAWKRILLFFGLLRPYFSFRHNLYLACYFYPIYLFALAGIKTIYRTSKPFFYFSTVLVVVFVLSVSVTCDDWHNRFIMPLMPIIISFAASGVNTVFGSRFNSQQKTLPTDSRR